MRITLDSSFDGGAWPGPLADRQAVAGEAWLGPIGFLGTLETLLGLAAKHPSSTERSAALIPTLLETDGFWSASATADPLATAQLLVSWGHALSVEGWEGEPASPRLAALGRVTEALSPGVGERLRTAAREFGTGARVIDSLVLLEPRASFPRRWRELFDALEKGGTHFEQSAPSPAHAPASSDLFRSRAAGFTPKRDGSLQLIRPYGPLEAADAVAAALAATPGAPTLFINPEPVLDLALARHGLPTTGARGGAGDNALLQLLPLVLAMGWKPPDPWRAHELLTLRESPVRGELRWRLIHALQRSPGVDSDEWRKALAVGLKEIDDPAAQRRVEVLLTPRVPHGSPYPSKELEQRVGELRAWLQARCKLAEAADEAARFGAALGQCETLLSLVAQAGLPGLEEAQLRRFVDEATASASGPVLHAAQAGFASVRKPGAVAGPVARIVWWRFDADTAAVPRPLPLTVAERAGLLAHGIVLPDAATLARSEVGAWRRPLAAASQSLWLVCPRRLPDGEAAEPHPVWDEVVGRFAKGIREAALDLASPQLTGNLPLAPREGLGLIGPQSQWKTTVPLERREKESPSSIEGFLGCSFRWAVERVGDLSGGLTEGPASGPVMLGILAHHIIEQLMKGPPLSEAAAGDEAERLFEEVGPRLAAPLFLPGWTRDRSEAAGAIRRTAGALAALRKAGWEPETVEEAVTGTAFQTVFEGKPDVVLKRGTQRAVLDLKWGSRSKHLEALQRGTALQLSAYAQLLLQTKGELPHVAYFIVREGRLLTGAAPVAGASLAVETVPIADTWAGVESAHRAAWKVFSKGALVAPGVAARPRTKDELLDDVLALKAPCEYCGLGGLCGARFGAEVSE